MIPLQESFLRTTLTMLVWLAVPLAATAQSDVYLEPLNEKLPPGFAADTLARVRQYDRSWLQPVQVELPTEGTVAVYSGTPEPLASLTSPAQFSVNPGHIYRLRISNLPEMPGVEIYPSIEILDRLHPPFGSEARYPVPVVLTERDLREALHGRLVTRVVYLENPRKALPGDSVRTDFPPVVGPTENALQEAGRFGRPMIIIRVGGRVPTGQNMPWSYFGSGGAVDASQSARASAGVVNLSDRTVSQGLVVRDASDLRTIRND